MHDLYYNEDTILSHSPEEWKAAKAALEAESEPAFRRASEAQSAYNRLSDEAARLQYSHDARQLRSPDYRDAVQRASWKDALPTIRASVERTRSAPEAVMRAPRSQSHIATEKTIQDELDRALARAHELSQSLRGTPETQWTPNTPEENDLQGRILGLRTALADIASGRRGGGGSRGDKARERASAALARLTPTDKQAADAQRRRDRLNSTEGMQTRHEMHVLFAELELARAQVNAATPGTAAYTKARANAAAIGTRVNANGQRYRDIESGKIKVGPPRTEPMTFTSSGKSSGGKSSGGKSGGTRASSGATSSKARVGSHKDPASGIRIPNDATDLQAREMVRYANNHYRDLLGMSYFPGGHGPQPAALTDKQAASVRSQVNAWFKEQRASSKTA